MPAQTESRRTLVVGNWKMNGMLDALPTIGAVDEAARLEPKVEVALAVPATLLLVAWRTACAVRIGAQDIHASPAGPFTGCLSAPMVADAGASFCLIGHSECRLGRSETDADIAAKVLAAERHGLSVILCVGETLEAREAGKAAAVVRRQVEAALPAHARGSWISIAYEPIWAIGTGRSATQQDIQAMHAVLRRTCWSLLGAEGEHVRLLYGGSVTQENALMILATPYVDGVLVGGASLKADSFAPIIAYASQAKD